MRVPHQHHLPLLPRLPLQLPPAPEGRGQQQPLLRTDQGRSTCRAWFYIKNAGTYKYLRTTAAAPADGFFQETTGSWAHVAATTTTATTVWMTSRFRCSSFH